MRIGAATDEAFDRVAARSGPGLHRLLHGALPQSVFERWNAALLRRGKPVWDPSAVYHLRGVPDDEIGMTVDTSSVARRIVAGLRAHRSQQHVIVEPGASDEQWARSVGREHYVIARPAGRRGGARLTDVFQGLPGGAAR